MTAVPPRPRIPRTAAACAAVAVLAAAASGCATTRPGAADPAAPGAPAADRVVRVVAAENFWGSLAAQLGGRHAAVTSVIGNPATDPHDYEPTAADARAVDGAQLAVVNGVGYDAWADRLLAADPGHGRTELKVGDVVGVRPGGNPHRWYAPADVHRVVDRITAAYRKLDPADARYFADRRTTVETGALAPYDRLVAHIRSQYAGTPIGASESIVAPLAEGLGLKMLTPGTFLDAVSEGADPTAGDKAAVDRQIRDRRIRIYVYNSQNSTPDVQQQIKEAKAAGIPVATVTETLTPAGATFQQWQVRQLKAIARALAEAAGK